MPKFTFRRGERIYSRADHAFDRETGTIWYRCDRVVVDGEELEGFIQVKQRRRIVFGRDLGGTQIEVTTCFHQACVQGSNPEWLIRQNETLAAMLGSDFDFEFRWVPNTYQARVQRATV